MISMLVFFNAKYLNRLSRISRILQFRDCHCKIQITIKLPKMVLNWKPYRNLIKKRSLPNTKKEHTQLWRQYLGVPSKFKVLRPWTFLSARKTFNIESKIFGPEHQQAKVIKSEFISNVHMIRFVCLFVPFRFTTILRWLASAHGFEHFTRIPFMISIDQILFWEHRKRTFW